MVHTTRKNETIWVTGWHTSYLGVERRARLTRRSRISVVFAQTEVVRSRVLGDEMAPMMDVWMDGWMDIPQDLP